MNKCEVSFTSFRQRILNQGACILVRLDLNVPCHNGRILDTTRLDMAVELLRSLQNHRLVLLTHWGRPKGYDEHASVAFLAPLLMQALQRPVVIAQTPEEVLPNNPVTLLENIRFFPGEISNDPAWGKTLAQLGDVFINDAFSASHRAHASITEVPNYLPSFMGPSFEKEWEAVQKLRARLQEGGAVALIGGSKVSSKIGVLECLLKWCDSVMIGGGMGNTFLAMQGVNMAESFVETDGIPIATQCWKKAGDHIVLPVDGVERKSHIVTSTPQKAWGDIGPQTLEVWRKNLARAKTVFWNGPMGVYEEPPLDQGSRSLAQFLDQHNRQPHVYSVVGGGDTLAVTGSSYFSYKSPSGGAFLEAIETGTLPGVKALLKE